MSKKQTLCTILGSLMITTLGAISSDLPPSQGEKWPSWRPSSKSLASWQAPVENNPLKGRALSMAGTAAKTGFNGARFIWGKLPPRVKVGAGLFTAGSFVGFWAGVVVGEFMSPFHWMGRKK